MKKSKVYTRTGDRGETSLVGGTRIAKSDLRIQMYGEVDELNSRIGWGLSLLSGEEDLQPLRDKLQVIQSALFDLGSNLACEEEKRGEWKLPQITTELIQSIEACIDQMDSEIEPLKTFVLPGGTQAAAAFHLCRTGSRHVERYMVAFERESGEKLPENSLEFMNRLSDYFFVLARNLNHRAGVKETPWIPR